MQQLTYVGPGRLEWREVPPPKLEGPREALVRPIAAARCDLDRALLFARTPLRLLGWAAALHLAPSFLRKAPIRGPYAFGHECVGEVVSCGEAVKAFRPGQKVVVPFQISCGDCSACTRGLTASCATVPRLSMYGFGSMGGPWGGVMSDLVRVPFADGMLVAVPDGIDPASLASASDNLPDAWRTVAPLLQERPGATVLVVGGGAQSVGLYAAAMAVALGAGRVDYLDASSSRLVLAQAAGAHPIERRSFRSPGRYAITVDASARPDGLSCALRSLEPEGVCTSVGIYFRRKTPVPLMHMYSNGVTLRTGRVNARAVIPEVLALVQSGRLKPECMTTRVAPWAETPAAFFDPSTKVVVAR